MCCLQRPTTWWKSNLGIREGRHSDPNVRQRRVTAEQVPVEPGAMQARQRKARTAKLVAGNRLPASDNMLCPFAAAPSALILWIFHSRLYRHAFPTIRLQQTLLPVAHIRLLPLVCVNQIKYSRESAFSLGNKPFKSLCSGKHIF